MCSLGSNVVYVTVFEMLRVKDFDVDFDPSESSKVKFDGAKLGIGLQQAPLRLVRHPAKFQPDRANGLRDVRYQFFHFLTLGANI